MIPIIESSNIYSTCTVYIIQYMYRKSRFNKYRPTDYFHGLAWRHSSHIGVHVPEQMFY